MMVTVLELEMSASVAPSELAPNEMPVIARNSISLAVVSLLMAMRRMPVSAS